MAPVSDGYVLLKTCFHVYVMETLIWSCNKERLNLPRGHFAWLCKALVQRRLKPSLLLEEDGLLRQLAGNALCANV